MWGEGRIVWGEFSRRDAERCRQDRLSLSLAAVHWGAFLPPGRTSAGLSDPRSRAVFPWAACCCPEGSFPFRGARSPRPLARPPSSFSLSSRSCAQSMADLQQPPSSISIKTALHSFAFFFLANMILPKKTHFQLKRENCILSQHPDSKK